jgi:hypothetical protein
MSTRQMLRRLAKVEHRVRPKRDDSGFTLEELCRAIWRDDEKGFRRMACEYGSFRYFVRQFELEGDK